MRGEAALLLEQSDIARYGVCESGKIRGRDERDKYAASSAPESEHPRAATETREAGIVAERDDEVTLIVHQARQIFALTAERDYFEQSSNGRIDVAQCSCECMKELRLSMRGFHH